MNRIIKFGENVEGYNIPVMNEREIRAAAGIFFLLMSVSVQIVIFTRNFTPLKYAIIIFLFDFIIRVFINPKFSPSLIIGRLIVSNQIPEYVGAPQKRFAWMFGVVLASVMFFLLVIANSYSSITGIICFICLIFLFFEAAFGICIGCKFYKLFNKQKVQYCPGEICDPKIKKEIQQTSLEQLMVVFAFLTFILSLAYFFNDTFSQNPNKLF